MPKLTTIKKEEIYTVLGYSAIAAEDYKFHLNIEYFTTTINRIDAIFNELATIDLQLIEARKDSMATKVDDINVDFTQHVNHLNISGSKLLKELSNLVGLSILYNKYSASTPTKSNSSFYSYY